jgi:Fic family protein
LSGDRHSVAAAPPLLTDPDEIARKEAENGIRQFNIAIETIRSFVRDRERPFKLRPSLILQLHHAALDGLDRFAGTYRNTPVKIGGSGHEPPQAFFVAEEVEHLCGYVNDNWERSSALHLAAYVLWRLNWIHPFADGNGRTARAVSNVVLNVKLDSLLPGAPSIPEQIAYDKRPYYAALEEADRAWTAGKLDCGVLEDLLGGMLARQLLDATKRAAEAPAPTATLEDQTKTT